MSTPTLAELARMFDHSLLQPNLTDAEMDRGLAVAVEYGVASVCIKPYALKRAAKLLAGTPVAASTVIGFPHGGHLTRVKVFESELAIADGATGPDPFNGPATVALCADNAPEGLTAAQLRVQHLAKIDGGSILPVANAEFLDCTPAALGAADATNVGGRLLHALLELVAPQPLFASTMAFAGGIGGLKGSFSPFEVVYGANIVLAFQDQPANGTINTALKGKSGGELSVKVTGAQGTPWEDILVRITAVTNNGAGVAVCGNEAVTDETGVAHFPNLTVSKAGGYFLVATTVESTTDPDVAAYSTATVNSDRFNLKNSTIPTPCS